MKIKLTSTPIQYTDGASEELLKNDVLKWFADIDKNHSEVTFKHIEHDIVAGTAMVEESLYNKYLGK